jgi:hypothetical protein
MQILREKKPTVIVVPPPKYSEYSGAKIDIASAMDATNKLWVGSVELLFCCSF